MHVLLIGIDQRTDCLINIRTHFESVHPHIRISLAFDIRNGLQMIKANEFDLIGINTKMKGNDLLKLLTSIRLIKSTTIVIVTDALDEDTAVALYEYGADTCIAPFFRPRVAIAFLESYYRRYFLYPNMQDSRDREGIRNSAKKIFHGDLIIDPNARIITYLGRKISLSKTEFDILHYLAINYDIALTHHQIYEYVWRTNDAEELDISVYISRLRKKIFSDPKNTEYIQTVRGVGYMFCANR